MPDKVTEIAAIPGRIVKNESGVWVPLSSKGKGASKNKGGTGKHKGKGDKAGS